MDAGRPEKAGQEGAEAADAGALGRLGYAQELLRRMGGFSSFAISFSIISVLAGCITAYADAIGPGGPAALGLGWPLVSAGTMFVALAMAELASAFPTAGALYQWSALLGGAGWGWMTAAMNLVGQVAIAWIAVFWSIFVLVVCSLPPNQLPAAMLAATIVLLALLYFTLVRTRFEGPRVKLASLEEARSTPS
jgi:amino acid transporter